MGVLLLSVLCCFRFYVLGIILWVIVFVGFLSVFSVFIWFGSFLPGDSYFWYVLLGSCKLYSLPHLKTAFCRSEDIRRDRGARFPEVIMSSLATLPAITSPLSRQNGWEVLFPLFLLFFLSWVEFVFFCFFESGGVF